MEKNNPIALFDMDNTLCDYNGAMFRDLEKLRSPDEEPLTSDFHDDAPDHLVRRMSLIKTQPDWWKNLEVFKLGMDVYRVALLIGFETHILTQGPMTKPNAWGEKVMWCHKHLGEEQPVTVTRDKGLVYGKVLVDDYPPYLKRWLKWRKRGLCIMPAHDYNESFKHPNVIRYDGTNMSQVQESLQKAFDR